MKNVTFPLQFSYFTTGLWTAVAVTLITFPSLLHLLRDCSSSPFNSIFTVFIFHYENAEGGGKHSTTFPSRPLLSLFLLFSSSLHTEIFATLTTGPRW